MEDGGRLWSSGFAKRPDKRRHPSMRFRPSFVLDQNAPQDHGRALRAPGSLAFPVSVRASARHDGRLHECGIQDSEASVQAGAPLVEIGDPLNLQAVADLLSADATQIEKGAVGADAVCCGA